MHKLCGQINVESSETSNINMELMGDIYAAALRKAAGCSPIMHQMREKREEGKKILY